MKVFHIANKIIISLKTQYFGFVRGHSNYNKNELFSIKKLINTGDEEIINDFEQKFSNIIGHGNSVSFSSGRMSFYALMQALGIKAGDEIVLLGHTCSVMPNAVWRMGGTPIFADIDPNTFGSSAFEIEKVITPKTKMIVIQHSFGIPCNIEPIVKLAKSKGIFLLEDCAISVGSKVKGIQIGNFGHAALFSIDHSKPINAIIGGLIYTKNNKELYNKLKEIQKDSDELPKKRQKALWEKFLFERKYYNPENYGKSFLIDKINRYIYREGDSYLTDDYTKTASSSYPYPAKLPPFLAKLGLLELERWEGEKRRRQELLKSFIELSTSSGLRDFLPPPYFDQDLNIIPLRFVYTHPDADIIRKKMSKFIDTSWFWFAKPIVACKDPRDLGYVNGSCPTSEKVGKEIINWPCVYNDANNNVLLAQFRKVNNL
jgi:dTDP-4-amino-4,6-dideoxygalactose transaminase